MSKLICKLALLPLSEFILKGFFILLIFFFIPIGSLKANIIFQLMVTMLYDRQLNDSCFFISSILCSVCILVQNTRGSLKHLFIDLGLQRISTVDIIYILFPSLHFREGWAVFPQCLELSVRLLYITVESEDKSNTNESHQWFLNSRWTNFL